jgi:hypothetical protein
MWECSNLVNGSNKLNSNSRRNKEQSILKEHLLLPSSKSKNARIEMIPLSFQKHNLATLKLDAL